MNARRSADKAKEKTARRRYIALLEEAAANADDGDEEKRAGTLACELIADGLLRGSAMEDRDGAYVGASICGMTVKGRLFLQGLRREEYEAGWRHKACTSARSLLLFISGILSALLIDWLKRI